MGPKAIPWAQVFLDVPSEHVASAQEFWSAVTGATISSPWEGHPEFVTLTPAAGAAYVHVQEVGAAPRVHVDLTTDDIEGETVRLVELGARRVERFRWWQSMTSPGGLPFCLCGDRAPGPPPAVSWPDGHRSRIVQVCLDIPAASFTEEPRFWAEATGWTAERSRRAEFESLVPPRTSPVKLLLQRLGDTDPRRATTAHIDLGTDNIAAEVDRLLALGATDVEQPPTQAGGTRWRTPSGCASA